MMLGARTSRAVAAAVMTAVAVVAAMVPAGAAEPGGADHAGGHDGAVSATVNDTPFKGGSRRLAGCSIEVAVAGLQGTAGHELTATVRAVEPTGSGVVFEQEASGVLDSWTSGAVFLGDALAPYRIMPNGYHVRVSLAVDGAVISSAPYWLACGATQHEGGAWWVQFLVEWQNVDGSPAPTPALPADWGLLATSERGTASCRYGPAGQLLCTYVDDGHGEDDASDEGHGEDGEDDESCGGGDHATEPPEEEGHSGERQAEEDQAGEGHDEQSCGGGGQGQGGQGKGRVGLRVPGLGTYTVEQIGLPAGWAVDERTVGEFLARAVAGHEGGHGTSRELTHVVVNREQPLPPLPPEAPPAVPEPAVIVPVAAPAPAPPDQAAEVLGVAKQRPTLPATGREAQPLTRLGFEFIAAGSALISAGKFRGRRPNRRKATQSTLTF